MMYLSDLFNTYPEMLDFYDVNLEQDTALFIEPGCILSADDELSKKAWATVRDYFQCLFEAYRQHVSDAAKMEMLEHLHEVNATKLGYGNGRNGKAKTPRGMLQVFSRVDVLFDKGIEISHPLDLPLLFPGYGADCLSDAMTNILLDCLSEYTYEQANMWNVDSRYFHRSKEQLYYWDIQSHCWKLCQRMQFYIDNQLIMLVPKRWLRSRIYCNTTHFLRYMILHPLQESRSIKVGDKVVRPRLKDLNNELREKYGAPRDVVMKFVQENPSLLSRYHRDLAAFYHKVHHRSH